jgi:hypothetical protein
MDRIDALLQTLQDQRANQASADSLLATLSLLQFELQKNAFPVAQEWGTSKVSVLLPLQPSVSSVTNSSKGSVPPQTVIAPETSVNDRLRDEKPILAETMQGSPIKDLRRGISLNERYQLVKELFEGDETRFDKAIKTINAFSILAEAQFWIDQELRSKPGWPSQSPSAQLLDQLIKRRFS